jgi:hypothetical protein
MRRIEVKDATNEEWQKTLEFLKDDDRLVVKVAKILGSEKVECADIAIRAVWIDEDTGEIVKVEKVATVKKVEIVQLNITGK